MPHRTDAAHQTRVVVLLGFLFVSAGCASLAKRDPAPSKDSPPPAIATSNPRPAPVTLGNTVPPLKNASTLAITTPANPVPASESVKPASLQIQAPPTAKLAETTQDSSDADPIRRLYLSAVAAYAKQSSYIARLRRREYSPTRQKPEEVLIFKFREQPYSVHFKWLGEEGKGREVIYVRGQADDKLHILTAAGDIPFTPAGRRLDLAPDSLLVRSASRYPITEAGIGSMIARFGKLLDAVARQDVRGLSVKYLGPVQRPEYPTPLEGVECQFPPGREPELPQGGKKLIFFDPVTKFPAVSMSYDATGREVDYYCFDRFQLDVRLDDDDFRTEKLWGPPGPPQ